MAKKRQKNKFKASIGWWREEQSKELYRHNTNYIGNSIKKLVEGWV